MMNILIQLIGILAAFATQLTPEVFLSASDTSRGKAGYRTTMIGTSRPRKCDESRANYG